MARARQPSNGRSKKALAQKAEAERVAFLEQIAVAYCDWIEATLAEHRRILAEHIRILNTPPPARRPSGLIGPFTLPPPNR
jgi:hypothetical protein